MKRLSILLIALLVALLGVGSILACEAEPEKPVILRFAEALSPEDMWLGEDFVERFNERAEGKCTIELHYLFELFDIMEAVDAVRTGAVEIASFPIPPFAALDARFGVSEVPYLWTNIHASHASLDTFLPLYNEVFEEKFNQKVLNSAVVAPLDPVCATKPIETLEDWDGLLMQSISPVTAVVIEMLGGSPAPIPYVEAYTSLQKGVVDATIQSATDFVIPYKLYEVADYITLSNLMLPHTAMNINLDTFNSLPKDIRELLVEECLVYGEAKSAHTMNKADNAPQLLSDLGMQVYVLPKAERDRWLDVLTPYREQLIADYGEFGQKALEAAKEANVLFPY